jgi:hypothetical protein
MGRFRFLRRLYGNADTNAVPDTLARDDAEWKHL